MEQGKNDGEKRQRSAVASRRLAYAVGVLLLAASVMAVGFEAVDDRGVTVVLDEPPQRVVVLGAFYAQMLVDLQMATRIVGLGESPDNPSEIMDAENVGPVYAPSVELIIALSPDLVLGATDWNGDRAALERAGIATYSAPSLTGVESIYEAILSVGSLLDVRAKADEVVDEVRASIETQEARVSGEPVRVAYLYAQPGGTLYAMGTGTPEDDLIGRAGLANVFSELEGYPQVSIESVISFDPIYLITDPTQMEIFEEHPVLSTLPAVKEGRMIGVPARLVGSTQVDKALMMIVGAVYGE